MDSPTAAGRDVNPLLFIIFCPHCVLSGIFALTATGTITLPAVLGVPAAQYLGPAIAFGGFFAWLAWGQWSKRSVRLSGDQSCASSCAKSSRAS